MTTTPPSRSQLNDAMEFFASFAGSAYKNSGTVELEADLSLPALQSRLNLRIDGNRTIVQMPEEVVQKYMETWLRANWEHITDCMVDAHCALEDGSDIEDLDCPKVTAHGEHYWDAAQFQDELGPHGGALMEYHCEGIKAHARCMIAGGRNADA